MNDIPKSILTILALLGLSLSSIGQTSQTNAIDQIDSIITAYMTTYKMVGVSIGIVKDGKIYLTKGYGTAEIGKVKPVDSLTNFLTCSITKLFTATAIMQLSEQGKMDISKKLIYYLPDFKMKDKRYQNITIEHLLTHTSGLYWDMGPLKIGLQWLPAPGTKFNATETYSNAAYDILGYLVQEISGKPYQEYIRDNILVKQTCHIVLLIIT
ncbi:MAG: beta-lactamase family protein [Saprospirales bacterium]|nr:beta-lactamase family protein [Saprospirales bacterium]